MKLSNNTVFTLLIILMATCNFSFNALARTVTILNADTMSKANYAEVNGIKMYYEIHGEGKPLILIHGGGSTIETNWSAVLPLFAKYYKVIAVELQAHGHTSDRNAPESFEQDADDVAALLQQLKISNAYVVGFSNGSNTSMQIAIRHPELVRKLVLTSGFYQRDGMMPGFFDMMKNASLENMPQPLKDGFLKINPDTAALLTMHNKDRDRMIAFKDWADTSLQSIKAPALIISAYKDVVLPEHALKMSKLIPNAELIILPGIHGAFWGEICSAEPGSKLPEITVELVHDFLEKSK